MSSDISWYSESNTEFHIKRAAQLKGLSDLVKDGHSFEGKTVYLDDDIDLGYNSWRPIGGNYYECVFNGTFDAQNHKVAYVHPKVTDSHYWSSHCYGLFGEAGGESVIRNLSVSGGMELYPQDGDFEICAGGVVGSSRGKIENVHSNFDIGASDESSRVVNYIYVGGVCGKGNEISFAQSRGAIELAFANVYWRGDRGNIGGVAGSASKLIQVESEVVISVWARNNGFVGGIVGFIEEGGTINNAAFYGSLKDSKDNFVYGDSPQYSACGGILGGSMSTANVSCCISAPTLMSATSLPGFDSNIWDFSNGKPMLKALKVKYCVSVRLDKGLIGYVVSDGGDLSLKLMTDAGYAVSKVYFNDTDVTDCLQGQDLNLTNITRSGELKFIFTQDDSAVEMIENNTKPSFSITGKNLVFDDVTAETPLRIYNAEGRLVCSMKVNSNQSVPLNSGIYIVKLGKYTYKVSI